MDKKVLRKIKIHDRLATVIIRSGGVLVIASVILILFLIGKEALPLFYPAEAELLGRVELPAELDKGDILSVGVDEYLGRVYAIDRHGLICFFGAEGDSRQLEVEGAGAADTILKVYPVSSAPGKREYALLWDSGLITLEQIRFVQRYDSAGQRYSTVEYKRKNSYATAQTPVADVAVARSAERTTLVRLYEDQKVEILQQVREADLFGNLNAEEYRTVLRDIHPDPITALELDSTGETLYLATAAGGLMRLSLLEAGETELLDKVQGYEDHRRITGLEVMQGNTSLAVGDARGAVNVWFPAPTEDGKGQDSLQLIHPLSRHEGAVTSLVASARNRTLLSIDATGTLNLDYSTSERHLLTLDDAQPVQQAALAPRGNGFITLHTDGAIKLWRLHNSHPEISFKSLFGRVWYESYEQPEWVWQSSSASDDFEPKLSLTPLIFGTLKGTFYAMIFSVPLALLGAIYTSQFGSSRLRERVKPAVEIMAAIPTVIIGFLAALWFAPLLEQYFPAFVLSMLVLPLCFILMLLFWLPLRRTGWGKYIEKGRELLVLLPVLVLAGAVAFELGPWLEAVTFGGSFKQWLYNELGVRYDVRNSIVIAFALGFAVIPIIFTMAEDALSNVPASHKAASMALGASRWQTVWRVVLPSASPGIFAAVMIGLGRAVGETMIVLMATGNTPIMDFSIFNGMRPLSSNIAVEIPEAPQGDTLYRVLFLSAVLLFAMTFVLNTAAEMVRHRLRKKYGRF
ncbi:MAG: ABC transporter permease subunit [Desulfuromonadaceae bacterium]|nr:ABC transporter permease subunit [Desulfuromonadaceae bacterium]